VISSHKTQDEVSPMSTGSSASANLFNLISHISPPTFHAHLQPPNLSLPNTVIKPSLSHQWQLEIGIEQFESPEMGCKE